MKSLVRSIGATKFSVSLCERELQRKTLATNPAQPQASEWLANHLKNLIAAADALGRSEEADAARRELAEHVANRTKPDVPEKRP
jgi:hypothetical protein